MAAAYRGGRCRGRKTLRADSNDWKVAGLGLGQGSRQMASAWGRWFGIVVVVLAAFLHMLSFATYPWWSAAMIAIDVLILFGLTARWQKSKGAPM